MQIHIITIFPNMFTSPFAESIIARAIKQEKLTIVIHNLRDWTTDNYQSVDDHPYGGGAGMVMKIEPIYKAIRDIKKELTGNTKVIVTSAKGKTYSQQLAVEFSQVDNLILICGHYEGIDERVIQHFCDYEISIGNYVLSGGETAAMVVVDSIARLLPGVVGNQESLETESHNHPGVLEYPHYTKPSCFATEEGEELKVPEVLLSGDPKKIAMWETEHTKIQE